MNQTKKWRHFCYICFCCCESQVRRWRHIPKNYEEAELPLLKSSSVSLKKETVKSVFSADPNDVKSIKTVHRPEPSRLLLVSSRDENWRNRLKATTNLERYRGSRIIEALIDALDDPKWQVRQKAAMLLGKQQDPVAIKPLIETLETDKSEVSLQAARSLGMIGNPMAIEQLVFTAINNPCQKVRREAVLALKQINDRETVNLLIEAVETTKYCSGYRDSHYFVINGPERGRALVALGEMADPRAIKPVSTIISTGDRIEQQIASDTLVKIGNSHSQELIDFLQKNASELSDGIIGGLLKVLTRVKMTEKQAQGMKPLLLALILAGSGNNCKIQAKQLLNQINRTENPSHSRELPS